MIEAKIRDLLAYLEKLGLTGSQVEKQVIEGIFGRRALFKVYCTVPYGEESMFFELHFQKDFHTGRYRLDKYFATHRSPIHIEHKIINGIDTADLERRMSQEDWRDYFESGVGYMDQSDKERADLTIQMLDELAQQPDFDGQKIQEELEFKYFPRDFLNRFFYSSELAAAYEHRQEFLSGDQQLPNIHEAFHLLSGRLKALYEKIRNIEIENSTASLYILLRNKLLENPKQFTLQFGRDFPEGYARYTLPIVQEETGFTVEPYTLSLTAYPDIIHGVYAGIDTLQLEEEMEGIDWRRPHSVIILDNFGGAAFQPAVKAIQEKLNVLSEDAQGRIIAAQLQLKYWTDESLFSGSHSDAVWQYIDSLPKIEREFPETANAEVAYNLLCGRAVMEHRLDPDLIDSGNWIRLNFDVDGQKQPLPMISAGCLYEEDLKQMIKMLPVAHWDFPHPAEQLCKGCLVTLPTHNGRTVILEANPEGGTLNIYTADKRPILVNINLDPDWKGPRGQMQPQELQRPVKKTEGNLPSRKITGNRI